MRGIALILIVITLTFNFCTVFGEEIQQQETETDVQKHGLGCLGSGFNEEDRILWRYLRGSLRAGSLPTSIDWRDYNGSNWITSIKDQGTYGSCVAFGVNAALEARLRRFYNDSSWNLDLSEQHVYEFGGGLPLGGGMYISDALNYVRLFGSPEEWCNPYDPATMFDYTVNEHWRLYTYKIKNWGWLDGSSIENIKEELLNGPLVAAIDVYEDFNYYSGGIYVYSWGSYLGGHCITIIGYNDTEGCWICKNSWGTDWGEDGYFRMAYGQCGIEDVVSAFEVIDNRYPNLWINIHRIQAVDAIESIFEGEAEWEYTFRVIDGDEWLNETGIVDYPYSEAEDDVILDHIYRFNVKNDNVTIRIILVERDDTSLMDVADISESSGGGIDNSIGIIPYGAYFKRQYFLSNNSFSVTGDMVTVEEGYYKTSGLYDGSDLEDQNDANLWFNISAASTEISPSISLVKDRILNAPSNSVYFIRTGNIWDDSAFYAFYAYKQNLQIIPPPTQSSGSSAYLDVDGKPLFTGDIITFGGRFANKMIEYYEDQEIALIGYEWNQTHHLFVKLLNGSPAYAIEESARDPNSHDFFVIQIYSDGDRLVFSEWGIGARATYAGGICFIDLVWSSIEEYVNGYYIFSWTDLNGDGLPQTEEIALEASGN